MAGRPFAERKATKACARQSRTAICVGASFADTEQQGQHKLAEESIRAQLPSSLSVTSVTRSHRSHRSLLSQLIYGCRTKRIRAKGKKKRSLRAQSKAAINRPSACADAPPRGNWREPTWRKPHSGDRSRGIFGGAPLASQSSSHRHEAGGDVLLPVTVGHLFHLLCGPLRR